MKKRYLNNRDRTTLSVLGLGVVGLCFLAWRGEGAGDPRAEPPPIVVAAPNASAFRFPQQDGEGLYRAVCQGFAAGCTGPTSTRPPCGGVRSRPSCQAWYGSGFQ